jgi:hypothetical protein
LTLTAIGALYVAANMQRSPAGIDYYVSTTPASWDQARAACQALGLPLVIIRSKEVDDDLISLVQQLQVTEFWAGASDAAQEGTWVWVDGSPVVYSGWLPNEPNNGGLSGTSAEECLWVAVGSLWRLGRALWVDGPCESARSYVCGDAGEAGEAASQSGDAVALPDNNK